MAAPRPGTQILLRDVPPARSAPTDTGVWFVTGLADKGALAPILITSMSDFVKLLGDRQAYSVLYDALDTYFHEGGSRAYVSRVVGPAAAAAFRVLNDAVAAAALRVEANSVGDWGNNLRIAVLAGDAGGEFKLEVSHTTLGILETSPSLLDKAAAFAWAANSSYIKLIDQASANDPAVLAASALAGGADDRVNIVEANWDQAVDRFTKDLGPGQVSAPGRTTSAAHGKLGNHALANNRDAILDLTDSAAKATLKTAIAASKAAMSGDARKFSASFAPWVVVPGLTGGTTRTVPQSALVAGLVARNDLVESPNKASAGVLGMARWAIGLSQAAWTDADRDDLNTNGINVIRMIYGGVRVYGWRSLADAVTQNNWINFGNARLTMAIAAKADAIAENYVLKEIDGAGVSIGQFGGELRSMLVPYYNEGSLYGQTPDEAFFVDVGVQVNTPARIAAGELHAVLSLKMSPFAELVVIEIVKVAITEAVA